LGWSSGRAEHDDLRMIILADGMAARRAKSAI
jgi:hypothetical protein